MRHFIAGSLKNKLILYFVTIAAVPMLIIGYLAFSQGKAALAKTEFDKLYAERELRKKELLTYFYDTVQTLDFMAETSFARSAVETLTSYHEFGKLSPDAPFDTTSELYGKMHEKIAPFFKSFMKTHDFKSSGYRDVLIVSGQDGNVMYSAEKLSDLGTNLSRGPLKDTGLSRLWTNVMKTGKPATVDFSHYQPFGAPAGFVGAPILDDKGKPSAVLVIRLGSEKINGIFHSTQEMGKSTEAYLVGPDRLMRSDSRFDQSSTILKKKVDTKAVGEAFEGRSGTDLITDFRDVAVLSSFSPVGLSKDQMLGTDFEWAVIAEVERNEAFQPVTALGIRILWIGVIISLAVIAAAYFLARGISNPVLAVVGQAARISEGDLTVDLPELKRNDELGLLVNAFRLMVQSLREQTRQILEGVSVLSSSSAEISATIGEVAANTSRTSTAVTETTATVEQVKQAARISSERAKKVAESSQRAVQISISGRKATEDTIHRMGQIKEQMETIGETVIRLSEHSQTIEQIMSTVQDLSDQSNLLAVNASIEAARAGDQGKGFSVVAQEIKALAEQSREATAQVRVILQDTQKWVHAVVMATEQGIKAVEAGTAQSAVADDSIQTLVGSVGEASDAAKVIDSSSEQQFVGVDQVCVAMTNIEQAMQQSLGGTAQLESAARRLQELGSALDQLARKYRV